MERALANLTDFDRPDWSLTPLTELDENAKAALAQIETEETVTKKGTTVRLRKVRLIKSLETLDMLMKYYGAYERKNRKKADPIREFIKAVSGHSRGLPAQHKRLDETGPADDR